MAIQGALIVACQHLVWNVNTFMKYQCLFAKEDQLVKNEKGTSGGDESGYDIPTEESQFTG